jgi:branched-chain amino acid transport system substrate-binding protein
LPSTSRNTAIRPYDSSRGGDRKCTPAVTAATLNGCADAAKAMMIPTTFAETTAAAADAATAVAAEGGDADLISMSSWEIVQSLKPLIERAGIRAQPGSVAEDRRRLRDALATLRATDGLLGPIRRTSDREAQKPYVFVEAAGTRWQIVHGPVLP